MWLYKMTLACVRLLELHSSVSVARGMSHHEYVIKPFSLIMVHVLFGEIALENKDYYYY